jgi:predicted transcriptional regulator
MLELRIMPNNKVDHPRKKSKDLADAMCGSVYNAISHSKREVVGEIEIHTWSSLKSEQNKKLIEEKQKPEMTEEIKDYLSSYRLL